MNRFISNTLFVFITTFFLWSCFSNDLQKKVQIINYKNDFDTIQGFFFYELNIPYLAFSKSDYLEQSCNLIFFDSLIYKKDISKLYKKGVFCFSLPQKLKEQIEDIPFRTRDNKSIQEFDKNLLYNIHENDTLFMKSIYEDSGKNFYYKKIYAKIIATKFKDLIVLVPSSKKFECCYSNVSIKADVYYISKVISFNIL